jgi:uncharacterized SAM-binding protein YcdF (DUF218 family)
MKSRTAWLAVAVLLGATLLLRVQILTALGSYLVRAENPKKADIAVVLAGGIDGARILTAANLVREGYAPAALVSGPGGTYGLHECDLAIPFAVQHGYPESYFIHFEHNAHSTREEAMAFAAELRRRGAKTVLLVTSNYHTRRARKLFRAAAPEITFVTVAAPDEFFQPDRWWRNREGQKTFLYEWEKTVATWIGL